MRARVSEEVRAPVVVDGVITYTSVSALQKAHSCPRAWWYKYVLRLPDKEKSKGLTRGTEGHERIAHFLTTGQDILDPLERLGVARGFVPHPLPPGAQVEHSIEGKHSAGPIPMKGSIDLYVPPVANGELRAIVRDWKFKADIGKWGCSADDLINPKHEAGIQMLGYAAFAVQQGAEVVEVSHVSFQTRGRPDVSLVSAEINQKEVAERWSSVVNRIVPEIIQAAQQTEAKNVRANHDVCEKYGGCPYKGTCLDRMARLSGGFSQYLRKSAMPIVKTPAAPPAAPVVPPAPAPAAAPIASPAAPQAAPVGMTASQAVAGKAYKLPSGAYGTFICAVALGGETKYSFAVPTGKPEMLSGNDPIGAERPFGAPAVLPPDAPVSAPKRMRFVDVPATVEAPASPAVAEVKSMSVAEFAATAEAPAPVEAKKRGRPPGSKNRVEAAPTEVALTAMTPEQVKVLEHLAETKVTADVVRSGGADGVRLYFGCAPLGVPVQTLHNYVADLEREIVKVAAQHGQSTLVEGDDLRTAEGQALGFGKWKGFIADAAKETLPRDGHYRVDLGGDERVDAVAHALMGILPPGSVVL